MRDFYFEGQIRMDWGFGNPNYTGALIAMLMVGAWLFAFLGRWGFWLALISNLVLGICLIQTFSRGSLVALAGGLVPVLWVVFRRRPWPKSQSLGVLIAVVILGGCAWQTRAVHRYGAGIVSEDGSVGNRWLIYRVVPRMMWDAPEGWGWQRSGDAYRQWYQPPGHVGPYVHLISTHATWLVESGWPVRVSYLFCWGLVFTLCAPSAGRGQWRSALLGVWIAFGLAASFSHIAREKWLWAMPTAALLIALGSRFVNKSWPTKRQWLWTPACVAGVSGMIALWALWSPWKSTVQLRNGVVSVCNAPRDAKERIGVLWPDHKVLGQFYGQRIREDLSRSTEQERCYEVLWNVDAHFKSGVDVMVISGDATTNVTAAQLPAMKASGRLMLINPGQPAQELADVIPDLSRVHWVTGQMWNDSTRFVWESLLRGHAGTTVSQIPMAGLFVPRWTSALTVPQPPAS